jgi:Beta-carotene isomerase D27-like, C-terminal
MQTEHTVERNTVERNTVERNTVESDTVESNTAESDTAERSTAESDTAKSDIAESNTTESNTTESNTAESNTVYNDNLFDRLFIWLFSRKMARVLGQHSSLQGYDGFVDLSFQMAQGRGAKEQQAVIAIVLQSLVPSPVLTIIRRLFSPTRLVCELNAWFATQLFIWLVGPCEVRSVEVTDAAGTVTAQRSGVHIKKCRYLEQSGCVGLCVNLCKLPTQKFFTEGFGIPLTMTPKFEDLSCEMVFGQIPPELEAEEVYHQSCLADRCETAVSGAIACPKVRL